MTSTPISICTELPFSTVDSNNFAELFMHEPYSDDIYLKCYSEDQQFDKYDCTLKECPPLLNVPDSKYVYFNSLNAMSCKNYDLSILNWNIRSIPRNIQIFKDCILDVMNHKPDIIGLTETRLDSNIASLYHIQGYNLFTRSRNTHGGGVATYIAESYQTKANDELSCTEQYLECLATECKKDHRILLSVCLYRPPSGNLSHFLNKLSDILTIAQCKCYHSINVFGDFNLDILKQNLSVIKDFINMMTSFSLSPLIRKPTRTTDHSMTLLDQIWVNCPELSIANYIFRTDITDHFPVMSHIGGQLSRREKTSWITKRYFPDNAMLLFTRSLAQVDWTVVMNSNCVNEAYSIFHSTVLNLYNEHFPAKKVLVKKKSKDSPYITTSLRKSIIERHRLERLARKWPSVYLQTYKNYRNNLTAILRAAKNNYYKTQLKACQGNPSMHWKMINTILGKKHSIENSGIIHLESHSSDVPNKFNDHFVRNTSGDDLPSNVNHLQYLPAPPNFSMYLTPTSMDEVEHYLQAIKGNSPGFDGLTPAVLKQVKSLISAPLSHIVNLSFKSGIFPDDLKIAKVIPIHKAGDRHDIKNYRPISILPAFSKVFEKAIAVRLLNYMEQGEFLSDCQHGFRAKHSTETAVLQFTKHAYNLLEQKKHTVGVFIDLSKAFDSLHHKILLDKLKHYGVRGIPLDLLRNYLSNRTQRVVCNDKYSDLKNLQYGVPQGSILGPLLFLVYINDITNASAEFHYTIYADDTNLLMGDSDIGVLHRKLTAELEAVNRWVKANRLKLNIAKTKCIFFQNRSLSKRLPEITLENKIINKVEHTKFLGVHIDKNLNWGYHIEDVCMKISRLCGLLYKIRHYLTSEAMFSIYYTLCYPYLIYCVSVWGCTWPSFLSKVKIAQNKVFRCIFHLCKYDSTVSITSQNKLLNFASIRQYFLILTIYKSLFANNSSKLFKRNIDSRNTRSSTINLVCPRHRTQLFKHSIFCTGPHIWNSLPHKIKANMYNGTINMFKTKLKKHVFDVQCTC